MGVNTRDATALAQFIGNRPKYPYGAGTFGVMNFLVDMAKVKVALGYTIDANNADVIQLWDIPALTHILSAAIWLYTPEGAAATLGLGDGDSTSGFLASFSINGAVNTHSCTIVSDAYQVTGGRSYPATDTFDIKFLTGDTDVAVAVFGISIACIFYEFPDLATSAPAAWH
jgi:hypothetical protein